MAWWLLVPGGAGGGAGGPAATRDLVPERTSDLLEGTAPAPRLAPSRPGPRPARPTYALTVRVLGVATEELGTIRLQLSWRSRKGHEGAQDVRADPSGTTVLDVERPALVPTTYALHVTADGPFHLPASEGVELPEPEERRRGLDLALEVRPERAGVLTGRVVDPDGRPVADALVKPDVWGGFTSGEDRVHGTHDKTGSDGRFRVRVRPGAELVALVWSPEFGPRASGTVGLRAGETVDVGTIRLARDRTWLGSVTGREGLPSSPIVVRTAWLGEARFTEIPGVAWTRQGLVNTGGAISLPAEGRFELWNVATGWWRVSLEAPDWGCAAVHDVWRATHRVVHTRDGPLVLDASRARLMFRTTAGGKASGGTQVILTGTDSLAFRTDASGYGCIVVRSDTRYRVVAFGPGLATLETEIVSAPNGQESTVELPLEPGKGVAPAGSEWTARDVLRLGVTVQNAWGGHMPARLRVLDASGSVVPTVWVQHYHVVSWRTEGDLVDAGEAQLVTELKPGDYRLRVEADGFRPHERSLPQGKGAPPDLTVVLEPE